MNLWRNTVKKQCKRRLFVFATCFIHPALGSPTPRINAELHAAPILWPCNGQSFSHREILLLLTPLRKILVEVACEYIFGWSVKEQRRKQCFFVCSRMNEIKCRIQSTSATVKFRVGALFGPELNEKTSIFLNYQYVADRNPWCLLVASFSNSRLNITTLVNSLSSTYVFSIISFSIIWPAAPRLVANEKHPVRWITYIFFSTI